MTAGAGNDKPTGGTVDDRRAAVGHYVSLSNTLISTAMAAAAFEAADGTRSEGKGSDPRISLVVGLEASGRGRVTIRKRAVS